MKTKITKENIILAKDFSQRTYKFHKDNNSPLRQRSLKEKKFHVFSGKLGEILYKEIRKDEITEVNYNFGPDPGYDFIDLKTDEKIDIKTLISDQKRRVYVNPEYLNSDKYIVIQIRLSDPLLKKIKLLAKKPLDEGWVHGELAKKEVLDKLKYDFKNDAFYVDLIRFKRP